MLLLNLSACICVCVYNTVHYMYCNMKCSLPFISYTKHFNYIQFSVCRPFAHFLGRLHNSLHVNEFRHLYFVVLFAIVKIGNYVINRIRQIQFSIVDIYCVCLYVFMLACVRIFPASIDEMNRKHFVCAILCKIKMFYALYAEKYISSEQWYRQHWSDAILYFIVIKWKDMWLEVSLHRKVLYSKPSKEEIITIIIEILCYESTMPDNS